MKRELERRNRMKLSTVLCASALALGSGLLGGPAYAQDVTADAFHAALESYRSRMLDAIWAIHSVQTEGPFCSNAEKQKAYGELLPLGRQTEELAADFDTFHTDVLRSMNYAYIAKQYYEADIHPEDRRTWADASAMKSRMLDLYKRTREELRKAKVIDCTQEETQTTETTTAGSDPTPEPGPDLPAPPPALNLASPPALPDHFCSELEQTTFLVDRINPLMIDADDQGQAWREYAQQLEKIAQTLHGASRNAVSSKARQARSMMHRAVAAARALDRARSTVIHTPVIDCATKDAEEHAGAGGATGERSGAGDRKSEDEESESDQVGSLPRDWNPEDFYVGIDLEAIGETLASSSADAGSYASATQRDGVTLDVTLPAGGAGSGGGGLAGNTDEEPVALARLAARDLPPDVFSTAAFDASRVSDAPVEAYLVATGEASGDAFRLHAINRGTEPVTLRGDGLVLEPLELGKKARRELEARLGRIAEESGVVATVTGYCLERLKLPPAPGQLFRVAPAEMQRRFSGAGAIMAAGRRLEDAGLLNPDGDPATYADAVTQWAIWVEQEGMSRQEFEDAFVEQIRENYDAAGREWTDRLEEAARGLVSNRWRDLQRVLEAAEPGLLRGGERR